MLGHDLVADQVHLASGSPVATGHPVALMWLGALVTVVGAVFSIVSQQSAAVLLLAPVGLLIVVSMLLPVFNLQQLMK